jgi:hypothetical protein
MKMKKNMMKTLLSLACIALLSGSVVFAKENLGQKTAKGRGLRTTANCAPASSTAELDVNNIRCLLQNGGDFWWDLVANPRYEVPKLPKDQAASARYSSFAGSLWIGGVDESGQLRVAAMTYRQSGNDFWPGPLTAGGATVDAATCLDWNKHYKITKEEIAAFRGAYLTSITPGGTPLNMALYPAVNSWPAFGTDADGNNIAMAPFVDVDNNPFDYNPEGGDYPDIAPCLGGGSPDQAIWWVVNDKGDVHTETGGEAIGLEIQMLAFAFATTDQVNDMTFYKYKVTNKSTLKINNTFMGQWVDSDLGNAYDDYVGCDTTRGLGFTYNGLAIDGTSSGYGANPPAFGLDFFQGPYGDDGNRLKMAYYVYYSNDFTLKGNPEVATHYYGYLRGYWKDGSQMVDNGQDGYPGTAAGPVVNYLYAGDPGWCGGSGNGGWSEISAQRPAYDRRFLQSAGPFTLQPGAVNDIVVGAVWARGYYNDQLGSVCELLTADDIAQSLFDNCFRLLDGPDAPELAINEYDQELTLSWDYSDPTIYNNYHESYLQADPALKAQSEPDSLFAFEGYLIYQLLDASVSANDVFNSDKARLVAQCDIKNGVSTIVNRTTTTVSGLSTPIIVDQVMVQGEDDGIFHSVNVTEDVFSTGTDRRLKNYTTYYFGALAYAYNATPSGGRKFVQGNRFFRNWSAVPHKIDFESFGTTVNSDYGSGIKITQTAGVGNGGNFVEVTQSTVDAILQSSTSTVSNITYEPGKAPIDIKVVNPKEVKKGSYRLELIPKSLTAYQSLEDTIRVDSVLIIDSTFADWILYEGSTNNVISMSTYIRRTQVDQNGGVTIFNRPEPWSGIERPIEGHGISIAVQDVIESGDTTINGFVGASMTFDDALEPWLEGIQQDDAFDTWDWILAGEKETDRGAVGLVYKTNHVYDKGENFENILSGTWAPFCLVRGFVNDDANGFISPGVGIATNVNSAVGVAASQIVDLSSLPDIDVIFTNDVSKWSKCVVVETASGKSLSAGNSWPMAARWDYPIVSAGDIAKDSSANLTSTQGRSWFPGYAIDVNTGRRLNIFFGENSWDKKNHGSDMLWNPTSSFGSGGSDAGGRHYVYVSTTTYDECNYIWDILSNGQLPASTNTPGLLWLQYTNPVDSTTDMRKVYKDVAWVGVPMLNASYTFKDPKEIPTTARVKLRVNQPFRSRVTTTDHPIFTFSTDDLAASLGVKEVATKSLLENVRVVPNPYYAFSKYERSQLQTIVKITNLPKTCKIKIFNLSGTLVRTYSKDSDEPSQNWDLKNANGTPVASGVYIIHIDAGTLGETVVKFFAVMPEIDLNAF